MENFYVGIAAKRAKSHDKLRVKDNKGLSQKRSYRLCILNLLQTMEFQTIAKKSTNL